MENATAGLPISCTLGPQWEAVITRYKFKSEAIFGFLSRNYTGYVTCFFAKPHNGLVWPILKYCREKVLSRFFVRAPSLN